MFAWIPLCLHVYVVTRACVSYTTDFLIKTNHTFIVFHIESCYLCRKSFNGEPKLLALVVVKVLIYTNHVLFWIPPEFLSKLPFSASDWLASLLAFATLNSSFPGELTARCLQVWAAAGSPPNLSALPNDPRDSAVVTSVVVFTRETAVHNLPYQLSCLLSVLQTNWYSPLTPDNHSPQLGKKTQKHGC